MSASGLNVANLEDTNFYIKKGFLKLEGLPENQDTRLRLAGF